MNESIPKIARRILAKVFSPAFYTVSPKGHLVFYWPTKARKHQPVSWVVEDSEQAEQALDGLKRILRRDYDILLTKRDVPRIHLIGSDVYIKIATHSSVPDSVITPALEAILGLPPR